MKNYLIADRYAAALDGVTANNDDLAATMEALDALAGAFTEDDKLRYVLSNPALQLDHRSAVLAAVAEKVGAPAPVQRLADALLRRGRIALLPDTAELFTRRADVRLNRTGADVTTATPMDEAQREKLRSALEAYSGSTVHMREAVNAKLLGGAVAKIGSVLIDGSVRSRLRRMRAAVLADER